jgi:hypothetical protein
LPFKKRKFIQILASYTYFNQKRSSKRRKEPLDEVKNLAKNQSVMWGPSPHQGQTDLLKNLLAHRLNLKHPLSLLARVIPWKKLEEASALWADGLTEPPS